MTYLDSIEQAWLECFTKDNSLILIGEDVRVDMHKSTLQTITKTFRNRVVNETPLVEELFGGIAIGLALGGLRPIYQINWSGFTPLLLDQLYRLGGWKATSGTQTSLPCVLRIAHDGYSHYGNDYELTRPILGSLIQIPDITIYTPTTPSAAYNIIKMACTSKTPSIIFEHKKLYKTTDQDWGTTSDEFIATQELYSGNDITIVSLQHCCALSLDAATILRNNHGIKAAVFGLHRIKPIDYSAILNF